MSEYERGYRLGTDFVNLHFREPRKILAYARYHMKRYRQTESDNGFIDAINLAFGG